MTTHAAAPIALCVHGHFYQPPRENPWTDQVPREPSAAPFHDWNARIHAECYRANAFARIHDAAGRIEAIVNNYDRCRSTSARRWRAGWDGTIRRWPSAAARRRRGPAAAARARRRDRAGVRAPDRAAVQRRATRARSCCGGCPIFAAASGAPRRGCGCPRPAVSPDDAGDADRARRALHDPRRPSRSPAVRARGRRRVDGGRPRQRSTRAAATCWRHRDGSGRTIALGVFDGPLSRAVAFGETADARREPARRGRRPRPIAPSADGPAAGAVRVGRRAVGPPQEVRRPDAGVRDRASRRARRGIEVTNLGAYLAAHPPTWEAQLADGPDGEGTAWSCGHGLGRWQRDCGCNMGGARGLEPGLARAAAPGAGHRFATPRRPSTRTRRRRAVRRSVGRPRRLRRRRRRSAAGARRALAALRGRRWQPGGEEARGRGAAAAGAAAGDAADVRELRLVLRRHRRAGGLAGDPHRARTRWICWRERRRQAADAPGAGRAGAGEEQPPRGGDAAPTSSAGSRATGSRWRTRSRARRWPTSSGAAPRRTSAGTSRCHPQKSADEHARAARVGTARAVKRRTGAVETLASTAAGGLGGALVPRSAGAADAGGSGRRDQGRAGDGGAAVAAAATCETPIIARRCRGGARAAARRRDARGGGAAGGADPVLLGAGRHADGGDAAPRPASSSTSSRLPGGAPDRRALEERVWELSARGRPDAPLRALAEKVGLPSRSPHDNRGT